MVPLFENDLDGVIEGRKYPDGIVVRVFRLRSDRDAYPPRWTDETHSR
ncbi:hypothetical protein ACFQAS_09110 [Halopenitus salinus]|uniref:Uncharacterized protein n=1 Tax=Halopenitus salinus TaxID=1198295 RepID=A0ABD5URP5_9EURY